METKPGAPTPAKFSIPSIIAIICAVGSFATGALFGFILAMCAMLFGVIGMILSFSPRVRGGLISTLGILGGLLGLIAAIVKGIAWLV